MIVPKEERSTQAIAVDPDKVLALAPNFQPDVDLLTAEGLIAFGMKGSGKSNLVRLLAKELVCFSPGSGSRGKPQSRTPPGGCMAGLWR